MPGVTPNEAKQLISNPQLNRLKDLGMGFRMGRVFGRRVLIQPVEPFTESDRLEKEGLIITPQAYKAQNTPLPTTGIVLEVGQDLLEEWRFSSSKTPQLSPGMGVMFGKYSGTECTVDKVTYRIVNFDEILCSVEDASNPEAYAVTTD